jgi:hypothetical protein
MIAIGNPVGKGQGGRVPYVSYIKTSGTAHHEFVVPSWNHLPVVPLDGLGIQSAILTLQ